MVVPLTQAKLNYRERNGFTERHSQHDCPTHGSHGYTTALERIRKGSNGLDDTPTPRIGHDSVIDSEKSTGFADKHVLSGWSCMQWIPFPQ